LRGLRFANGRRRYVAVIAALVGSGALVLPVSPAGAATQIGQTFTPTMPGGDFTFIQSGSLENQYAAPFAGVITSWSFQALASPPQLKLKVARPAGGDSFTIIGESGVQVSTPSALNTFPVRIPAQAGDVIGLYKVTTGDILVGPAAGYTSRNLPGDVPPGTTASAGPGVAQLDVSATLEPDADGDGFGDETQDGCPTIASTQGPCNDFTLGKPKSKKNGTATIVATVPNPGVLVAGDKNDPQLAAAAAAKPLLKRTTEETADAGSVKLKLKPTKRAKKKLKKKGKVKPTAEVVYTPTGGDPASQTAKVKLKK